MAQETYSLCFMCSVRCPIRVLVENDEVNWIEGNPHVPSIWRGTLCQGFGRNLALLNESNVPNTR